MTLGEFPKQKMDGVFPLTPAFSLREREKRSQVFDEMKAESSLNAGGFQADSQRLFLIPEGDYCCFGSSSRDPAEPEAARPSERERTGPVRMKVQAAAFAQAIVFKK
jgi:hypothetical protein